jgi:hypothetical protein
MKGDSLTLFGQEHVDRYVATDGEEGHNWEGTQTLILTTTGRRSGEPRPQALIYGSTTTTTWWSPQRAALAASRLVPQLEANPEVEVQVKGDKFKLTLRTATPGGEADALADHDQGVAVLRRVPDQDRPRHPGRDPRTAALGHERAEGREPVRHRGLHLAGAPQARGCRARGMTIRSWPSRRHAERIALPLHHEHRHINRLQLAQPALEGSLRLAGRVAEGTRGRAPPRGAHLACGAARHPRA